MSRILSTALAALAAIASTSGTVRPSAAQFPPRLEHYLTTVVRLTGAERNQLLGGAPVTRLLDADETKEVAVFGAIWIRAPMRRYVDRVKDIENFERGGGFKVTKRISTPPAIEDFAGMHISDEDLADLRSCRVGDCEVKLSEQALNRFRSEIDWNSPNARARADRLMQQVALEYVTGYLEGGNDRLAVYRDKSRPTFVAREFRAMTDQMPELVTYLPPVRKYLLEYPNATLPGATSFLYWQEAEFGLKPIIRINHLAVFEGQEGTAVTSQMLYANHYFWTGLELRVLLPDPPRGEGFWFATVSRSRSDGLSGFTGQFVRRRARGGAQEGSLAALKATKQTLESVR